MSRCVARTADVSVMCPRVRRVGNTTIADLQALYRSPLTDSNRRPPPYHRATRREPRARPGSRGHERRARTRIRPKARDRAWTPVPALVFPQCSLGVSSPSWRKHAGAGSGPSSLRTPDPPARLGRTDSAAIDELRQQLAHGADLLPGLHTQLPNKTHHCLAQDRQSRRRSARARLKE